MSKMKILFPIIFALFVVFGVSFNGNVLRVGQMVYASSPWIDDYYITTTYQSATFDLSTYNYRIITSTGYAGYNDSLYQDGSIVLLNFTLTAATSPMTLSFPFSNGTHNIKVQNMNLNSNYPTEYMIIQKQFKNRNPSISTTTPSQNGAFHTERRAA